MNRTSLMCVVALLAHTVSAHADDRPLTAAASTATAAEVQVFVAAEVTTPAPLTPPQAPAAKRPGILMGMYAVCGLLNAYDGYSTIKAIAANHVELNPFMAPLVKQPALVIAAKAAVTVATIAAAENLWRTHHRTHAVVLLVVTNGVMAAVAANNASVLRGSR